MNNEWHLYDMNLYRDSFQNYKVAVASFMEIPQGVSHVLQKLLHGLGLVLVDLAA